MDSTTAVRISSKSSTETTGSTQSPWEGRDKIKERKEWIVYICPLLSSLMWFYKEHRYLQVLRNQLMEQCLGLFVLCEILFWFTYNTDKGGNSLTKHFECTPKIRLSKFHCFHETKQTQNKIKRFFFKLAEFLFKDVNQERRMRRISLFTIWSYCYLNPKHVIQHVLVLPSPYNTFFDVTNFYKTLLLLPIVITKSG